jgi:signal transduction histidine kinase/CheY-like chemotaxis protein
LLDSDKPEEAFFRKAWEAVSDGRTWRERVVHRCKDGTYFTVDASMSPIRDNSGEIIGCVSVERDVTERLRLEAQFRQSQKMESVGRLAGGVAHDYNNMLSVILGNAELAMAMIGPGDPLRPYLRAISDAGNRSSAMTRQLLAFARKQTITPKILDLNETIEGLLKMIRRLIGENIDLTWIPKANSWPVKMDPSQIDQILVNLCINARDAISDVGKIIIETENVTIDEGYCADHIGFSPGEYIRLAVSDNGNGMDQDVLSQIFEPFFTTKAMGKGSGLGLATSYGIVKQNNGFINAYSEPGKGSTICVYLPRYESTEEAKDFQSTPELPLSRGESILLVEDEAIMMDVARQMLEKMGYKVLTATSPKQAINLAKQNIDMIDLLITDIIMPEMNGRQLADQIKTFSPTIKILFMSGYTSNIIAEQGMLQEGMDLLQKPFSMHDLAMRIRMVLDNIKS